tara:strand:+ start:198 stop:368 length:171 start_codon:yes stop_codon:yes gene_type:complete
MRLFGLRYKVNRGALACLDKTKGRNALKAILALNVICGIIYIKSKKMHPLGGILRN